MNEVVHLLFGIQEVLLVLVAFLYIINRKPTVYLVLSYFGFVLIPLLLLQVTFPRFVSVTYLIITACALFYYIQRSVFTIISLGVIIIIANLACYFFMYSSTSIGQYFGNVSKPLTYILYFGIYAILVHIYKYFIYDPYKRMELPLWMKCSNVIFLFATIAVIYVNSLNWDQATEREVFVNLIVQMSYFVVIILLYYLLFTYVEKRNEVNNKVMEQQQFLNYMKELELVNFDMHKFRHDYVNILLTMRTYLDDNNLEGLRKYFHEHIIKVEQETLAQHMMFTQFKNIKIQELKGLIATKLITAEKNKIMVNVEIPDVISSVDINMIDLARIIGILLDNAIEESENVSQPSINLAIIHNVEGDIIIVIENRTIKKEINISQLSEAYYSTKGKNRGVGLATVRCIVEQYKNVQLDTKIDHGWFTQTLRIKPSIIASS